MRRDLEFKRRYREAASDWAREGRNTRRARPVKRAQVRWSVALGERFLELVRETGNARQSAMTLGAPNAFANRMKRDPEFRRRVREALAIIRDRDGVQTAPTMSRPPHPPDAAEQCGALFTCSGCGR